jgi:hypothetical protein
MRFRSFVVVCFVAILASGCAAMRERKAMDTERILAAAGFQMKLASTADKKSRLAAFVPQRQLTPQQIDGAVRFVWADSEYCKCVYVGSQAAHGRFQKLALEKQMSDQQLAAANANEAASMDWGPWGGWGPWY